MLRLLEWVWDAVEVDFGRLASSCVVYSHCSPLLLFTSYVFHIILMVFHVDLPRENNTIFTYTDNLPYYLLNQATSTLPLGTPLVLLSLREKNCMIGIISSRLLGILSPDLR